jgi:hypothetical protein
MSCAVPVKPLPVADTENVPLAEVLIRAVEESPSVVIEMPLDGIVAKINFMFGTIVPFSAIPCA